MGLKLYTFGTHFNTMPQKEEFSAPVLYNVTVSLDPVEEKNWRQWMQLEHIPQVLATGCFEHCVFSKVNGNEPEECTYSILYWAINQEKLDHYFTSYAEALQKDQSQRYEGKFAAFRTTMNVVNFIKA